MKRLVIAVDCDDVLVHTTPYFVKAYNEQYGTHGTLEDAPDVYSPVWEADPETIIDRWTKLTETAEYKALEPSDNEVEILKRLANTHKLHLVTARKEDERLHTLQMINRKLSNVFTSLEFVGWGGSKGQVCRNINADVLIDDSYRNLKDAIEHGLPFGGAILFGALPATQTHKDEDNIVYCQDWLAVEQHVTRLADS